MIAPRKYVHLLLIISHLILVACALIMIIKYDRTDWDRLIWIGSKILTLKKMIKENNNKIYPILDITENGTKIFYNQSYVSLLKHSGKECDKNYKQCGILDTLGNKMCIPKDDICPINDIIIGLSENHSLYSQKGYKIGFIENMTENHVLYYTNTAKDKQIVAKLKLTNETLRYIHEDNFIFDEDTYQDSLASYGGGGYSGGSYGGYGGGGGSGGGIGGGGGGFRRLKSNEKNDSIYGDETITKYIKERFEDEINIDKTFKNVSDNIFIGNYLGFQDISNLDKYSNLDLYDLYFTLFPNELSFSFSFVLLFFFIAPIGFSFQRFFHKDVPNEGFNPCEVLKAKLMIIIHYLIFLIGYLIYLIYAYNDIYKNKKPFELVDIKADPFIEDLLKEIQNRHLNKGFILAIISLYFISLVIFIIAWILSRIFTKRYLNLLEKVKSEPNEILIPQ